MRISEALHLTLQDVDLAEGVLSVRQPEFRKSRLVPVSAGTLDALRDGIITRAKAELIVRLTQYLSDDEARKVEAKILGRAGRLTPGSLRSALARAVMEGVAFGMRDNLELLRARGVRVLFLRAPSSGEYYAYVDVSNSWGNSGAAADTMIAS